MRRILFVAALAAALAVAVPGVALAAITPETTEYTTAEECYECHQGAGAAVSRADFSADTVDYTKCATCHDFQTGLPGHYHLGRKTCGSCHNGVTKFQIVLPPDAVIVGGYPARTAYGYFAYPTSLSSTPDQLHALHDGGGWVERAWGSIARWPNGYPDAARSIPCSGCHAAATCTACHVSPPAAHGNHAVSAYPAVAARQATGTAISNAPLTCINPSCHALAAAGTPTFVPGCGSCHGTKTGPHGYADVDHVAADGLAEGYPCSACHPLDLAVAHGDPTAIGASCATCHPAPRDSLEAPWDQTCATGGCHSASSTAPMHEGIAASHAVSVENEICLECHLGADLGAIHVEAADDAGKTSCLVCHTGADGEPFTADCTVCHFTFDTHYDESAHLSSWTLVGCGGSGCHGSRDLLEAHTEKDPAFTCDGCHKDFAVALQIEQGLTGCGDCHDNIYQTSGHRSAHWPNPLLSDAGGPRYSYYTGSAGSAPTNDCIGCHTSNLVDEHMGLNDQETGLPIRLPRYNTTGAALTCDSCHGQPEGSVVRTAIATGQSACESCHTVHGPMQEVHASSFVDAPSVPCEDCHSANLTVEHNGGYTSSAGLTGCDVCHALYTGELAASVQAAISSANDTACDSCHATYHDDPTVHQATSAQSLSCGACHAPGADMIDVTALHAGSTDGSCTVCHASQRVGDIGGHTAECGSCHSTEGEDYHTGMGVHVAPESAGCQVDGCHHSQSDVRLTHGSCETCHADASDPGMTTACANCHGTIEGTDFHLQLNVKHEPTDDYSTACASCHETTNVTSLHVTQGCDTCHFINGCTDCHTVDGTAVLHESASCSTCHNIEGPAEGANFHAQMTAKHTFGGMGTLCAGCHAQTLPEAHEPYLSRYPAYGSTCDLCHKHADPSRIDWTTASADCATCHEIHGDITQVHTAAASQACVACHETALTLDIHATAEGSPDCAMCHEAPEGRIDWSAATIECASCHAPLLPVDPQHYPTTAHEASAQPTCGQCHSKDLKTEHAKPTVAVSCVTCHEVDVDGFTASWNHTCEACHPIKHANQAAAHKSTTTACSGTNCHAISDAGAVHGTNCQYCHAPGLTPTTTCTICHSAANPHHAAITLKMTTSSSWATVCGSCHGRVHSWGSCSNCHSNDMHGEPEHVEINSRCAGCHKIATADSADNCLLCHTDLGGGSGGSWGGGGGSWGGGSWGR